ncbi:hypothetical protein IWX50DRAFT_270671 [Phyllosticta citricarpa]
MFQSHGRRHKRFRLALVAKARRSGCLGRSQKEEGGVGLALAPPQERQAAARVNMIPVTAFRRPLLMQGATRAVGCCCPTKQHDSSNPSQPVCCTQSSPWPCGMQQGSESPLLAGSVETRCGASIRASIGRQTPCERQQAQSKIATRQNFFFFFFLIALFRACDWQRRERRRLPGGSAQQALGQLHLASCARIRAPHVGWRRLCYRGPEMRARMWSGMA